MFRVRRTTRLREEDMRELEEIATEVVDAAYHIHKAVGPGLLESVYGVLLERLLHSRGLRVERQKVVPFELDGVRFDHGLRLDLLVEDLLVAEVKSVERLAPVHRKQVLTYLRLLDLQLGLLINFGGATLKDNVNRIVNNYVPGPSPLRIHRAPP
jgi:GxxExxY protein